MDNLVSKANIYYFILISI